MTIRNATMEDLGPMVDLLAALFAVEADFDTDPGRQRRGLQRMLDGCGKHRAVLVAEASGRVVGMCTGQTVISTAEGGLSVLVEDVVVAEPCQGRGIGAKLMAAIEAWAIRMGATRLQLLADRENAPGLAFYDRLGWEPTRLVALRKKPTT